MDDLAGLVGHLTSRRSAIVEGCRGAVVDAPESNSSLSGDALCGHVPAVLDAFERWLSDSSSVTSLEEAIGAAAADVGARRWRQNRSIGDLVREVTLLETRILEEVDAYERGNSVAAAAMTTARRRLAEFCGALTAHLVTEYASAKHADAANEINRLELDLTRTTELERRRAQSWRKAAHDLRGSLSVIGNASSVLALPNVPEQMRAECGAILERGIDNLRSRLEACIEQAQGDGVAR